jgi:hypothetical protein
MIDQVAMSLSHHPEVAVALFLHRAVADVAAEVLLQVAEEEEEEAGDKIIHV